MKKLRFLLVLIGFILSACSTPQKATVEENMLGVESTLPVPPTEVPTEGPTAIPTTNPSQQLSVEYEYMGMLDKFMSDKVDRETIIFHLKDGKLVEEPIKPKVTKNILFVVSMSQTGIIGSKGINVNSNQGVITLWPIDNLEPEAGVKYIFQINNCDSNFSNVLICRVDGGNGFLNFSLDLDQNIFQYSYSGVWDFRYSEWIDTTLTTLGYISVKSDLNLTTVEGGKYTIHLVKK